MILSPNRSHFGGSCAAARMNTLASLRGRIERIEAPGDAHALNRVALGHAGADAMLRGGLAVAAVHEVFAEGRQGAVATGFIAGLAGRITRRRPLVWVRHYLSEIEPRARPMSTARCAVRPMRSPATRSAPSCWKFLARRVSSIWSRAAN